MLLANKPHVWLIALCACVALAACGDDDNKNTGSQPQADMGGDQGQADLSPDTSDDMGEGEDAQDDAGEEDMVEADAADMPDNTCTFAANPDLEPPPEPELYTPRWAFEPWISKDISDRDDTYDFVEGFQQRDIPVGVVVLDSPWETNYNTLIPNPNRYPQFPEMVADLRQQGIRVVLWTTQMINRLSYDVEIGGDIYDGPASNYREGRNCGFYIQDGRGYNWWKGTGAALDFFNPDAMQWWHQQQNLVLDAGVAGWKLDFGDSYIKDDPVKTAAGDKPFQEYSEAYYRDFLAYGQQRLGREEFVTMVRAWDASYDHAPRFYARPEHAPVIWVGDNRRDFVGLIDALDHTFLSASAGYAMIGSDIGGYLDRNDVNLIEEIPFNYPALARWTAIGAMSPFMQLHGRANLTPWNLPEGPEDPEAFVQIYRYWSWLHSDMVPFWYSLTETAHKGGANVLRPVGATPQDWENDWRYQVGDAFLVVPVLDETGRRDIALPEGARWYNWWAPGADPLEGGQVLVDVDATDLSQLPMFVREGAIVPMHIRNDVTGLCQASCANHLTTLIWPSEQGTTFDLHEEDGQITTFTAQRQPEQTHITLGRALDPQLLRVRQEEPPSYVTVNDEALATSSGLDELTQANSGYAWDRDKKILWIKVEPSEAALTLLVGPPL